jgi:signal transduction histidine kinase
MTAKILIVCGKPDELQSMVHNVKMVFPDFKVLTAAVGAEALQVACKEQPDIVLLDVEIQGLSGFEICKRLTSQRGTSHISVILITSNYNESDHRVTSLDSGAVGLLTSPIQPKELIAHIRSIVRLKEREGNLRKAHAVSQQANDAKSTVLAGISHEFRTPLNSVIGFSQALLEEYFGVLNAKQKEYLNHILDSGQRLNRMVDAILDIANICDDSELDIRQVRIADIFEGSLDLVRERCIKQGITLRLDIAEDIVGLYIPGDLRRLRQIMYMLLANAVKFMPEAGTIIVSAVKKEHEVEISVRDEGVGIVEGNLEQVFDVFFQEKSGRTDKSPGMGVSLNLAKRLVHLHGGRVWAESEGRNKGSRFVFTLPI